MKQRTNTAGFKIGDIASKRHGQPKRKPRPPKRFNKVGIPQEGERRPRERLLPGEAK